MSKVKEDVKKLLLELNELTKGEIFPRSQIDEEKYICYPAFLKVVKKPEEEEEDYEIKLQIYNKLKEFVQLMITDDPNFYDTIIEFGFKKFEEYKKRQKLHYLYNCEIGIDNKEGNEKRFKLYEMSAFKAQVENGMYPDENYYKKLPDWMIDIKNYTDIIIPINCQTVFLFNPTQKAVVDLRKEELFLIP
jgi:hypothetical protein